MPAPPNKRRTSTSPKLENNSRMSSGDTSVAFSGAYPYSENRSPPRITCGAGFFRDMRWLVSLGGRLELHRFATAAGRGLVRIVEHELRGELVGLVVHLGAD